MGFVADTAAATCDWAGLLVRDRITVRFPSEIEILDVGACFGKYRYLLPEYPNVDACEVWEPYVEVERLREKYRHVYVSTIQDLVAFEARHTYTVAILGDVLEHLARWEAQHVIDALAGECAELYVVVPYQYEQGAVHGNPYEVHQQDDLTIDLMATEYPELELDSVEYQNGQPFKGLYVKRVKA